MAVRLSGLISGMDTESLVQQLVSAYSVKKDNYVKEQTKLEWQMEAWKALNTKVYSFYSNALSKLRFSTTYSKKAVTVSDSTKAKVTADSNAVNGDQTLSINKLAKTGYLTGAKLGTDTEGKKITTSTKLSSLAGFSEGMINVKVEGKEKNINVTEDMTVAQFIVKLKDAGLNASYDETNQRMFISSKTSGVDHDFALTGNDGGTSVLKSLGIYAVSEEEIKQYSVQASYSDEELENFALNEYLSNVVSDANKTYTQKNTELSEANALLNKELTYANMTSQKKAETYVGVQNKISKLESEIAQLENDESGADNTSAIEAKQKQIDAYNETLAMYDGVNEKYGIKITGVAVDEAGYETVSEPSSESIEEYKSALKAEIDANTAAAKVNTEAIEANKKLLEKTYTTEEIKALEITAYGEDTPRTVDGYESNATYQNILSKYENLRTSAQNVMSNVPTDGSGNVDWENIDMEAIGSAIGASDAVRISGQDSEIVLNGAVFTSNSNNYSVNGLTITATGVTNENEQVTVTTSTDVDGIYNMIKDFFTSYNELIKEMDTLYNADSSKGYEPLTDEEKDAMSDTEVEKWEKKIKDSLLRRDSTLSGVINAMKTAMSTSYKIGDTSYSLSSFGISTLGYFVSGENEKGVYHIDGNADDSSTSGNTDKLRKAIASDPDTVISFFSKLTTGLYDTLTKKMASSTLSSAYTIYNDKYMKSRYEDYDDTIEKWEQKVTDMEDKYYAQFAAMETALSKLQSSSSALSSLIGS